MSKPGENRLYLCVLGAIAASACQHYSAKPLSSGAIEQRLAMPTTEQLQHEVAQVHNPLMPPITVDLENGLTPAAAGAIAVAHNPTIHADQDAIGSAIANVLVARILPNPQITGGADVPFGPNSGGSVIGYGLGLNWEITALIGRNARIRSAQAGADQIRLDLAWKQWQAAEAAKAAVYDVVALREQLRLAQDLSGVLSEIAAQAQTALERHDMTLSEEAAALSAAQEAQVTVQTTQRDLTDALLSLNQAMGFPPDASIRIDAQVNLPSHIDPPATSHLLEHLDDHRIDLVSLRRGYDSQEEAVRAAILAQFPKISLGISNTRDYGNFLTLGPSLTIDLPIFDRNQGVIATARATRQQLFDEYTARVFEARSGVARAAALMHSLNGVIRAQDAEVHTLRQLVAQDEKALKSGNMDVATYFAAAVNLAQRQVDLIKSRQDLVHAEITLEIASGTVLPLEQGLTTQEGHR